MSTILGNQPGTPLQEIVRDLFAEVLRLPRHEVGPDDDFFRLGGPAADAGRLLERAREVLGVDLGDRALEEAPTPQMFAELFGDVPVAVMGPCGSGTDSALLPLRLRGPLDVRALEAALEDLGRRHETLRNSRLGAAGTRLRVLGAREHLLELAVPGDTIDLWSQLPLAAELSRAYAARMAGSVPHRRPAALDAARRAVFGDLPPTPLPGSALPHAGHSPYGHLETRLDAAVHDRLVRFAAGHGASAFMVVHAALTALLARLGPGDEVTVAAPVPARDTASLREAVGPYGRLLALSVDATGDPAFGELLGRVRAVDLGAYRNGEAALALPGGVALAVLQEPVGTVEAAGLDITPLPPRLPVPPADLALTLIEHHEPTGAPAGLTLHTAYRTRGVGEDAAASFTARLTAVLETALTDPSAPLSRLRLRAAAEAGGGVWAGESAALPDGTAAGFFAAQAARTPRSTAVTGMDYAELDARSDLLAHVLLAHDAGPGTTVVTALSDPTGFAVAALAVAKTGAALLPVDPADPLPETLEPLRAAVLLLDETADLRLPAVRGAARLVRDAAADRLPAAGCWPVEESDLVRPVDPDDAVVLAPSEDGTVVIGAESVAAALLAPPADAAWLVEGYPDAEDALGLLAALVSGARVHVPADDLTLTVPQETLRWLREAGASTVLGGSDEVLRALAALALAEDTALTVSGGWPEGRLVVDLTPGGPVRPAPGYRAYVLDAHLHPVAPGATGALYISGAGVARGYADAPGATGERFLPDPFGGPDGDTARMWRTGHAARVSADGNLHVLDHPAEDDPFADEFATFVVVADATGHRALWPASAAVPEGWDATHTEDHYELCLDHLNDHRSA
ncbi:AMP-binding protein [Streptomyces mangrovisoli]|uniref:Carrier domain-containing protein n=1 Tax=Streptomyces mangrovisoli TaxID=1428628 RepID=A0A1J4P1X6_9ACTN|nr:AMP-binding protein [Streptomyces mangrovisoli]OIJ68218.1 hypothetical protein WN71_009270 [Streptomyces mangrovisoli]